MSTAGTVAAGILLLLAYMAIIMGLRSWARWAVGRQESREAAATFVDAYVPEACDVAPPERATDDALSRVRADNAETAAVEAAERVVYEAEMCDMLDDAQAHLDGLAGR